MTPLIRRSVDTLVKVMQKHCDTGQSVEVFKCVLILVVNPFLSVHQVCMKLSCLYFSPQAVWFIHNGGAAVHGIWPFGGYSER